MRSLNTRRTLAVRSYQEDIASVTGIHGGDVGEVVRGQIHVVTTAGRCRKINIDRRVETFANTEQSFRCRQPEGQMFGEKAVPQSCQMFSCRLTLLDPPERHQTDYRNVFKLCERGSGNRTMWYRMSFSSRAPEGRNRIAAPTVTKQSASPAILRDRDR